MKQLHLVIWAAPYPGPAIASWFDRERESSSLPLFGGASGQIPQLASADLDKLLATHDVNQVVLAGALGTDDLDWVLERVDGCRWLIVSSDDDTRASNVELRRSRQELALLRGATVFETSLVFGRGGDRTISPLTRALRRWRVPLRWDDAGRILQPVHIDDLLAAIVAHGHDPVSGCFPIAGDEALPAQELMQMLAEILGLRLRPISLPSGALDVSPVGRALARMSIRAGSEWRPVDLTSMREVFDWCPRPLAHRLEQAVREAVA